LLAERVYAEIGLPHRRERIVMRKLLLALASAVVLSAGGASAQTYPSRPITLIAPFPAGGPLDTIARILAEPMRASLGQPVVVENVPGAGGNLGTARLARAAPDGYTIGIGQWSTHVVNPITYKLPYHVLNDFEPIALLTNTPQLIIARKDFPAKDAKELIAWLKANPGKATAATVGAAGGAQVSSIYFAHKVGTKLQFVPFKGGGPAVHEMVAGRIDLMLDQGANALGHVRGGTIKAYAVMAKDRWAALPDVPSLDETGATGLHVAYWHAMWAPKGTPKEIIAKLNAAVVQALADPKVQQRLASAGQDIFPRAQQTPEALAAHHKAETDKWWPIVKATGLKAE
jgi:tripartite-type tricarboxylate transporter receptor subunit TctC